MKKILVLFLLACGPTGNAPPPPPPPPRIDASACVDYTTCLNACGAGCQMGIGNDYQGCLKICRDICRVNACPGTAPAAPDGGLGIEVL